MWILHGHRANVIAYPHTDLKPIVHVGHRGHTESTPTSHQGHDHVCSPEPSACLIDMRVASKGPHSHGTFAVFARAGRGQDTQQGLGITE